MSGSAIDAKLDNALNSQDDLAEKVEDGDHEVDTSSVALQGQGELITKGKGKGVWFVLVSGTLFWYKDSKLKSLKGDIALKGCDLEEKDDCCVFKKDKKDVLTIKITSSKADWMAALKNAVTLEAGKPPARVKGTGQSALTKAKKGAVQGIATSSMGKAMAKATINEDAKTLITCVKTLTTYVYDSKTANTVENNIIKLFVKAHFLDTNGQLTDDWYLGLDNGLREAFNTSIRICDNIQSGRTIPDDTLAEWIKKIQGNLQEVEDKLNKLLAPYLQPKSLNRISVCFEVFKADKFLRTILVEYDDNLKNDAEELQYAMERYLTISW